MTKHPMEPNDWSDASAELLRSVATEYSPSDADCERVRSALARRLNEQTPAPTPSADVGNARVGYNALGKLVLIGIAVACVGTGTVAFIRSEHADVGAQQPLAAGSRALEAPAQHQSSASDEQLKLDARSIREALERPVTRVSAAVPTEVSAAPKATRRRKPTLVAPRTAPAEVAALSQPSTAGAVEPAAGDTLGSASRQDPSDQSERDIIASPLAASAANAAVPKPVSEAATIPPAEAVTQDARAELAWLGKAQTALQKSKLSTVLALCAQHERRWPQGVFVQEREALASIASCLSGAHDAQTRAARFFRSYPHAPLRPRVEEGCSAHTPKSPDVAR